MAKSLKYIYLSLTITALFLVSCSEGGVRDDKPTVSVSILPQKYFTERLAGDNFEINVLVPGGSSPETYEPTPGQMRSVANSVIYFRIGYLEFESTIVNNIEQQNSDVRFVNTSAGMDLLAAEVVDHGDHVHLYGVDPHTWLTIPGVKIQIKNMVEAIIEADPGNSDFYMSNYNEFVAELDELHESISGRFKDVENRSFLVFHPALGYFARDYNLTQLSIEEEGKNPTPSNMRKIVDIAREENLKDVLIQLEFERENAMAVARELGGDVIEIKPLSENWLENMIDIADKIAAILKRE